MSSAVKINPRGEGLALALDEGTRKVHSMAENTNFVAGFFRGVSRQDSFAELTSSLYFVYEAMENALDCSNVSPNAKALDFSQLRRKKALERDMIFFFGDDWKDTVQPSLATKAYVEDIHRVADSDLLIAHLYSRYLGDLFGGKMMKSMATKSLSLSGRSGLEFYTFDDIPDTSNFIDSWYTILNSLDISADDRQAIVNEANKVFYHNINLFNELEGNPLSAAINVAWKSLIEKLFT
eukprot:CAMPEP_0197338494 /NCGR_PEP_ID=MMETSP0892-20130614/41285_1 /TAXON_ID=44058 ORGANISM="Aureoumbra lagunensis, Strain CCMP1510" /NCGR_SAMPLE_ID=MMETSP0892 /ASSEMBLY_ACC=CAM_ASM_000538 /LENGTH=236 /DNA_ID=CAMNT_0042841959 /DNA_START=1 /DNA_END=714 /DNA_ORIENTATION=-